MIFITAFILGLTANFHCLGMCGPLALAIPMNRKNNWTILFGLTQYNLARILSYSLLGALVGLIGITIQTFGILQWVSILSGLFMIIYAWRKWFSSLIQSQFPKIQMNGFLIGNLGKVLKSKFKFKLILLGALNGFLPCGMVYLALMNAILGGDFLKSALAMTFFGLGTLPAMFFVGFAANRVSQGMRKKFSKVIPYMLTVVGLMIVLRGMNLNIPYISPKITNISEYSTLKQENGSNKVVMSCCHKNNKCEK